MKDIHGKAILDHYQGRSKGPLILHTSYGPPEEMPVEVFFRDSPDLTTLEHLATMECSGRVLDLGAGAGAITLVLQTLGLEATALESSPGCVAVMQHSGVKNVVLQSYQRHKEKYDTILLLMNGLGIAGTLKQLPGFLRKCKTLLAPGGQLLLDSSDIAYLYDEGAMQPEGYYGEIRYRYEYGGERGEWFDWIYVDQDTLAASAEKEGFQVEILLTDENDQYLARLSMP